MKHGTLVEHHRRMTEAVEFVFANIDRDFELTEVSDHVCMSRFHFHRVFQGLLGETVGDLVRRLRLERSVAQLVETSEPITQIAFSAGYSTHESFIRAFRSAFSRTPSEMRGRTRYSGGLPTPNGIHYSAQLSIQFLNQKESTMKTEIKPFATQKAACMSHTGPYFMIGQTFGQLAQWIGSSAVPAGYGIGLYYDDPTSTPPEKLRSDAGTLVPEDFVPNDPRVHLVEVAGGDYLVGTYVGSYDGLSGAWGEFMGSGMPAGYRFRNAVPFELYIKMDEEVGGKNSITELYLPVEPTAS